MEKIEIPKLTIEYEHTEDYTIVNWIGKSQEQNPHELLFPALKEILDETKKKIIFNFEQLEYVNSSTVNPIIQLIKIANDNQIYFEIQYNETIVWQKTISVAIGRLSGAFKYLTVTPI